MKNSSPHICSTVLHVHYKVCTSHRGYFEKIYALDKPTNSLFLIWLRGFIAWSGKTDKLQRKKFALKSAFLVYLCMPLTKITLKFKNFACSGFRVSWQNIDSGTTRRANAKANNEIFLFHLHMVKLSWYIVKKNRSFIW